LLERHQRRSGLEADSLKPPPSTTQHGILETLLALPDVEGLQAVCFKQLRRETVRPYKMNSGFSIKPKIRGKSRPRISPHSVRVASAFATAATVQGSPQISTFEAINSPATPAAMRAP